MGLNRNLHECQLARWRMSKETGEEQANERHHAKRSPTAILLISLERTLDHRLRGRVNSELRLSSQSLVFTFKMDRGVIITVPCISRVTNVTSAIAACCAIALNLCRKGADSGLNRHMPSQCCRHDRNYPTCLQDSTTNFVTVCYSQCCQAVNRGG